MLNVNKKLCMYWGNNTELSQALRPLLVPLFTPDLGETLKKPLTISIAPKTLLTSIG
jgi:hypothetical protein